MSKTTIELTKDEIIELIKDFNLGVCSFSQSVIDHI